MCVDKATTVPEWARPILDSLCELAGALRRDGQPDGEYGRPPDTADAADVLEALLYGLLHEEASRE